MNEEIYVVGQFTGQTTVHPLGLAMVIILGLCVLFLSRSRSLLPLLIMACYVSSAQRVIIAEADFNFLRIMVVFGVVRIISRKEYISFKWTSLDKAIIFWVLSSMFFYTIRIATLAAIINRLGFAFDAFGMYFLFRCLIRDWQDVETFIRGVIVISLPLVALFLLENYSGHNMFSIFGGVPANTLVREGRLRCQGAFSHSILAGCFWASLAPLFACFWWRSVKDRVWSVTGVIASFIIIICCSSSTPVMGIFMAIIGGLFFFLRYRMRLVRWLILLTLIILHLVMNAPVWHLISRVSAAGGSTGWHRYNLINQAVINFNDWWFSGCSAYTVAGWGVFAGDVTNQYVLEGITGGFLTMCLFITVIIIAFREVGILWRTQIRNQYLLALSWGLGVSLFVHCVNFIGVSYFGQIHILWYLLLATIGSLSLQTMSCESRTIRLSIS